MLASNSTFVFVASSVPCQPLSWSRAFPIPSSADLPKLFISRPMSKNFFARPGFVVATSPAAAYRPISPTFARAGITCCNPPSVVDANPRIADPASSAQPTMTNLPGPLNQSANRSRYGSAYLPMASTTLVCKVRPKVVSFALVDDPSASSARLAAPARSPRPFTAELGSSAYSAAPRSSA
jgi:hypothetical protein